MRRFAPAPLACLLLAGTLSAEPRPRLDTAFPPGARAGSTVEVVAGGEHLDGPERLWFSHPGITSELLPEVAGQPRKFKVTVASGVPLGNHDVRFVTRLGVSNARAFEVGPLVEANEVEPNDDVPQAQRVPLETTVSGVFSGGTDVDYLAFAGRTGQRVLVSVRASGIDSRARPAVEVFDPAGRRLTLQRNYAGTDALADVTLPSDGDYVVRLSEFTYTSGGPAYFWRATLTLGPWIDAIDPFALEFGKPAQARIFGRNLPGGKASGQHADGRPLDEVPATLIAPTDPADAARIRFAGRLGPNAAFADGFDYRLAGATGTSNPLLVGYAGGPVTREAEPNDRRDAAQPLTLPAELVGRVDRRADRDYFRFDAKKGQPLQIDLWSDRLGAPTDLTAMLFGPAGNVLADADDDPEVTTLVQWFTRTNDPQSLALDPPADGTYTLLVRCQEAGQRFGPRGAYRLRVGPPVSDFRAVVMPHAERDPAATHLRPDGAAALDVLIRRVGRAGSLTVTATGLPTGVTAAPVTVPDGGTRARLILTAAPGLPPAVFAVGVTLAGTIDGKPVTREARPAGVTWPVPAGQNHPTVGRLERAAVVAIRGEPLFKLSVTPETLELAPNAETNVTVRVARQSSDAAKRPVTLTLTPSDAWLTANNGQPVTIPADKDEATFPVKATPAGAGRGATVFVAGTMTVPLAKDPKGPKADTPVEAPAASVQVRVK